MSLELPRVPLTVRPPAALLCRALAAQAKRSAACEESLTGHEQNEEDLPMRRGSINADDFVRIKVARRRHRDILLIETPLEGHLV